MDCGKTVYGQDWLSGGMCASCNMNHDREVRKIQEQHRRNNENVIKTEHMKKSKEECLLLNGVMAHDLGKTESQVMKAMDDHTADAVKELVELIAEMHKHSLYRINEHDDRITHLPYHMFDKVKKTLSNYDTHGK